MIRSLSDAETSMALELIWDVFGTYEAPEFSPEGISEFRQFLECKPQIAKLRFYGAWQKSRLLGVIAMRGRHISLFFVAKGHHNKGIGKRLFEHVKCRTAFHELTVNSSPYAVGIYQQMGFTPTDHERLTNGVRYTPMRFVK